MEVIRERYKIPFVSLPPPKHSDNNLSAIKEKDFVSEAVLDLLKMNCIEELDEAPPDIVNPLSVSTQSSGKKRLILDRRHVNLYVYKQKFKCEDLKVALSIISRGYSLTFNYNGLRITIETNKQIINFLDVTFNLNRSKHLSTIYKDEYFTTIRSPREQPPANHHKEHSCRHQQTTVVLII